jgi:hypothetical protein
MLLTIIKFKGELQMSALSSAEKSLEGLFKGAPALPKSAKDWLVNAMPWLALIFGVVQLVVAFGLFGLIKTAENIQDTVNTYSLYLTGEQTTIYSSGDKMIIYLGVAVLLVDAVIMLMAYPHLKKHARKGWDLLFLGAVINLVYAVLTIFIDARGVGNFLWGLIGSAIGFYFLFQIRDRYSAKSA